MESTIKVLKIIRLEFFFFFFLLVATLGLVWGLNKSSNPILSSLSKTSYQWAGLDCPLKVLPNPTATLPIYNLRRILPSLLFFLLCLTETESFIRHKNEINHIELETFLTSELSLFHLRALSICSINLSSSQYRPIEKTMSSPIRPSSSSSSPTTTSPSKQSSSSSSQPKYVDFLYFENLPIRSITAN